MFARRLAPNTTQNPHDSDAGSNDTLDGAAANPSGTDTTLEVAPTQAGTGSMQQSTPPCHAPSSAPGVSDTELRIGAITTLSGPVPGLGSSAAAATRAYVAYRNATGGVCGRRVVLSEADDTADRSRYRSLIAEMAPRVFGIAGGYAFGDVGGIDVIDSHRLPVVTNPSDDLVAASPHVFDINPPYPTGDVLTGRYRFLRDQGIRTVTLVYLAVAQSRAEAQREQRLMQIAGIETVDVQELALSTLSFDSPARRVIRSKADMMFFIGDARANAAMSRALRDNGANLKVANYLALAYGTSFLEQAGDAAEGSVAFVRTMPIEEASTNPEMMLFSRWMDQTAPGTIKDPYAAEAWAEVKAFLDTVQSLPGPISRDGLVAALRNVDRYDAGGMLGPIQLGREINDGCVIGMRVTGGRWQRFAPNEGFLC